MKKLDDLISILKDMESALLAYSGGVDSTFLLKAMQLSEIRALAVTAVSEITPHADFVTAQQTAEEIGIDHIVINTDELANEEFLKNSPERCFICKDNRFKLLTDRALSEGYAFVLDGSNIDDTTDFRPGSKAAKKHNVRSPLIESGFTKQDIRECSKPLGLSTWDKPSSPCLVTRFPFGQRITRASLKRVEQAEDFIKSLGFNIIRVRDHEGAARIEVAPDKIPLLLVPQTRKAISEHLKKLGYTFISLDPEGYGVRSQHLT
jgi:uncharacterized protein